MELMTTTEPAALRARLDAWGGTLAFLALDPLLAWPLRGLSTERRHLALCWDDGPAADGLRESGLEVICVGDELGGARASHRILESPRARAALLRAARSGPVGLLCFKPNLQTLQAARDLGLADDRLKLLAPPIAVARAFENKLRFASKVRASGAPLPPSEVVTPSRGPGYEALAARHGPRFVVQSGSGFSGAGTSLVDSAASWQAAIQPRPQRKVRVTPFIHGRSLTINAVVGAAGQVFLGAPMEQLTGWRELTPYELGSCGNVWNPADVDAEPLRRAATQVGSALAGEGYVGHFGIDAVVAEDGQLFVIEANPRFTATLPVDTAIARSRGGASLFGRHLLALLGLEEGGLASPTEGPPMTQWILRQKVQAALSPQTPWQRLLPGMRPVPVSPPADLDLGGFGGLLLRTPPGRRLEPGQEKGRLLVPGLIEPAERAGWLDVLRAAESGGAAGLGAA